MMVNLMVTRLGRMGMVLLILEAPHAGRQPGRLRSERLGAARWGSMAEMAEMGPPKVGFNQLKHKSFWGTMMKHVDLMGFDEHIQPYITKKWIITTSK
jgi:hypothetical protein